MTELTPDEILLYQRALDKPFFYTAQGASCLRLGGETRVDFLQRQTTNDLGLLSADHALVTVLTSPTARILDVLLLVDEGDSTAVLPLPGRAPATAQFLQSRIFFMDKVTVADVQDWTPLFLGGSGCDALLQALDIAAPPGLGEGARRGLGPGSIRVIRVGYPYLGDTLVLADPDTCPTLVGTLREAGAAELSQNVCETLRIENGLPAGDAELTEDYTPLEAGLQSAVADGKGCYTGQEVIARQLTYDKVVQRLVGLELERDASPGAPLNSGGRQVGVITSTTVSPRYGPIGLGYVRRPDHEVGTNLRLAPGEDGIKAVVCRLPFDAK